ASQLPASSNAVPAGTLIKNINSGEIGVTLTASGASTGSANVPGVSGGTVPNGGVGNKANTAPVATDGTWLFAVAGVADGDTTLPSGAVGRGTPEGSPFYRHTPNGTTHPTSPSRVD